MKIDNNGNIQLATSFDSFSFGDFFDVYIERYSDTDIKVRLTPKQDTKLLDISSSPNAISFDVSKD